MKRRLNFTSPFAPPVCVQRLQKLVERRHFYFTERLLGEVHVSLDSLETGVNSFRLLLTCSSRSSSFLPFIYLKLHGEMQSSKGETGIQLRLESDKPRDRGEWAFLGFWLFLVIFALAGGFIRIMTSSSPLQGILLALSLVAVLIGGYWVNQQIFKVSVKQFLNLIYHTLRYENSETQSQSTEGVEWLSSLSKSQ